MSKPELHPLINKRDSAHYDSTSEPTIQRFERRFTVDSLINWAMITRAKYADPARINKGEEEKDIRKYESYDDYYNMLMSLVMKDSTIMEMTAEKAYEKHNIVWRYT